MKSLKNLLAPAILKLVKPRRYPKVSGRAGLSLTFPKASKFDKNQSPQFDEAIEELPTHVRDFFSQQSKEPRAGNLNLPNSKPPS
jgi:hypothetical protein